MSIKVDLKIIFFLIIFYFTHQLNIYLIIMFFSIIHELGHIIVGLVLKMIPKKIEIMPFGISVLLTSNNMEYKEKTINIKEIFVAIAGPVTSFLLAFFNMKIEIKYIPQNYAVYTNLIILFFNLIPVYPLDGGRILKGILNIHLDSVKTKYYIQKISYITMIILTIISSIGIYFYKNLAIFFICIFLWIITLREKKGKTIDILR